MKDPIDYINIFFFYNRVVIIYDSAKKYSPINNHQLQYVLLNLLVHNIQMIIVLSLIIFG